MSWNDTLEFMDSVAADAPRRSSRLSPKQPKTKKEISLVRWRIGFSASNRGGLFPDVALQVEGIRTDDGENWTSSEVLGVELPRIVHTANTTYQLVGKIDARVSLEKGMPHEFIDKFTNGFPVDWKKTINEFIDFLFQHAGRQRGDVSEAQKTEQRCPKREFGIPSDQRHPIPGSPTRMASLSPLNSPSPPQTPTTFRTCSPSFMTPSTVNRNSSNFKNITVRRTAKNKQPVSYNAAPTPVLNRSQKGRIIKPRLAPGERIVYDCYGSPIEARKSITRTHVTNNSSAGLDAIYKSLNLSRPKSPCQTERRLNYITDRTKARKSKSRSLEQRRSSIAKLLNYDRSQEMKELDDVSFDDDSEVSPIRVQRATTNRRRLIQSDEESEESIVIRKRPTRKQHKTEKREITASKPRTVRPRSAKSKRNEQSRSFPDSEMSVEIESPVAEPSSETSVRTKSRAKVWNAKNKRDLEIVFRNINPWTERDWESVLRALPVEWTCEEVKAQAQKMKLTPFPTENEARTKKTAVVNTIRNLVPDGKLPQKGTIRREALEEVIMEQLFVNRNETEQNENELGTGLDDSDDLFIREAMQNHALDESLRMSDPSKFVTPSKRAFIPKPVSACRRRSSLDAIRAVGDDFSIPDRGRMKYRLKYRAQQFNRRHGINTIHEDNEEEASFDRFEETLSEEDEDEENDSTEIKDSSGI